MSMPSDVTPDVTEAVEAIERRVPPEVKSKVRRASRSLFRNVSPEQVGFAAAMMVAFLGVAVCGPKVREMRKPRRQRLIDRARRAAQDATETVSRQAKDIRKQAKRRMRQLGDGAFGR